VSLAGLETAQHFKRKLTMFENEQHTSKTPKGKLNRMEYALYDQDRYAWGLYLALKYCPEDQEDDRVVLWALLNKDQQEAIRIMRRNR